MEIPTRYGVTLVVDPEDEALARANWHIHTRNRLSKDGHPRKQYHEVRRSKREGGRTKTEYLGWLVLQAAGRAKPSPKHQCDHINGNPLDNRRSNLRWCTPAQNRENSSKWNRNTNGYKGIYYEEDRGVWRAEIRKAGRKVFLGRFHTKREAAIAYDHAALGYFGEYARSNGEYKTELLELLRLAYDYLALNWDMDEEPLRKIKDRLSQLGA